MTAEDSRTVTHTQTIKIIERNVPLDKILNPMIVEIIKEQVEKYAKDNDISKYKINLGNVRQTVEINISDDLYELSGRDEIMTKEAIIIENYLFHYFKVDQKVYIKTRKRDVIKYRQYIQFFMSFYSEMTLLNIGLITGKKDHATIMHSTNKILRKLQKSLAGKFKQDVFLLDRGIINTLAVPSKLFDVYGELLDTVKNHSK